MRQSLNYIYFDFSANSDIKTFYTVGVEMIHTCGYESYLYELPPYGYPPHHTLHLILIIYKD